MEDSEQARKAAPVADSYYDSVTLGEPYDCENCGINFDSLRVEQMSGGSWYIYRESGCYGGFGEEFDTVELAVERIEQFIADELTGKKNKRNKKAVREMIHGMQNYK